MRVCAPSRFSPCLISSLLARKVSTLTVFRCTYPSHDPDSGWFSPEHLRVVIPRQRYIIRVRYLHSRRLMLGWASITSFAGTCHYTPLCSVCALRHTNAQVQGTNYVELLVRRLRGESKNGPAFVLLGKSYCWCATACFAAVSRVQLLLVQRLPQFQVLRTPPRPQVLYC